MNISGRNEEKQEIDINNVQVSSNFGSFKLFL